MTLEERLLVLVDVSARLPYGVCVHFRNTNIDEKLTEISLGETITQARHNGRGNQGLILPYLRPMSSMTEEECKELSELSATIENVSETLPNVPYYIEVARPEQIDWLNEHHFDYRGLIEKGLALEAPADMYKN